MKKFNAQIKKLNDKNGAYIEIHLMWRKLIIEKELR